MAESDPTWRFDLFASSRRSGSPATASGQEGAGARAVDEDDVRVGVGRGRRGVAGRHRYRAVAPVGPESENDRCSALRQGHVEPRSPREDLDRADANMAAARRIFGARNPLWLLPGGGLPPGAFPVSCDGLYLRTRDPGHCLSTGAFLRRSDFGL